MNDTPRTNDIIEQVKGFRTSSAIYSLEQFSRELERELTTATEQLTKAHETIGTMIDQIGMLQLKDKATTEHRDRLAVALENCREDSIELLGERDWWQLENRGDYQQRYQTTRDNVTNADAALQSLDQNDERMDG
jgi:chromosome segregation ATPase